MPRSLLGAAAAALLAVCIAVPAAPAGAAVAACRTPPPPAAPIADLPWAQRWFAPERVWSLSRGTGVVVAVVDSGVDTGHPQLRGGQVRAGVDLLTGSASGTLDCDGHGTAVASIIAASAARDIGFAGLAPRAQILPVRVAEQNTSTADTDPVAPDMFADAIRWAADHQARIINASVVFYRHHQSIEEAVKYAQGRGVVVVAAVGNGHGDTGPDATPYPAAYSGVVGVGAIAANGTRVSTSYVGPHVDIVAPGAEVTVANPASGHRQLTGTSFATPFVSAALALLLAAEPSLSPAAAVRRLTATADPAAGPPEEYGHGVVNPYRALAERPTTQSPEAPAPLADDPGDAAARERAERARRDAAVALAVTGGAAGAGTVALLVAAVHRRGRRTGWSPARPGGGVVAEVSSVDDVGEAFYTVPGPDRRSAPAQ